MKQRVNIQFCILNESSATPEVIPRNVGKSEHCRRLENPFTLTLSRCGGSLERPCRVPEDASFTELCDCFGNAEDAEDAVQDGLLAAFRNLDRFEGRAQFSMWLTRIVVNAALMRRRTLHAHESEPRARRWAA